jgi:hypothetical protein
MIDRAKVHAALVKAAKFRKENARKLNAMKAYAESESNKQIQKNAAKLSTVSTPAKISFVDCDSNALAVMRFNKRIATIIRISQHVVVVRKGFRELGSFSNIEKAMNFCRNGF